MVLGFFNLGHTSWPMLLVVVQQIAPTHVPQIHSVSCSAVCSIYPADIQDDNSGGCCTMAIGVLGIAKEV